MDNTKSKIICDMDISVNASELKDTMDKILVTDNSSIKAPGYFKLFKYGEELLNKLDATYERLFMVNAKYKYWMKNYDIITNYNDRNHTPLSNTKIREEIKSNDVRARGIK